MSRWGSRDSLRDCCVFVREIRELFVCVWVILLGGFVAVMGSKEGA